MTVYVSSDYRLPLSSGYKYELALVLSGAVPIPDFSLMEYQLFHSLRNPANHLSVPPSPRARDEMTKSHFNYLLLDPRQLHPPLTIHSDLERFSNFVGAIFYVGKGKNSRSLQHLREAKDCLRGKGKQKVLGRGLSDVRNSSNGSFLSH